MSPKVDRVRRKIVYRCDWLTCKLEFDTREETIRHEIHTHYKSSFGCPVCNAKLSSVF